MAEGIQLTSAMFYCYRCDQEVSLMSPSELTCPECLGGFLEEVPQDDYEDESDVDESEMNLFDVLDLESIYRQAVVNSYDDDDDASPHSAHEHDEVHSSEEGPEASNPRRVRLHGLDETIIINSLPRIPHVGDYLFGDDLDALSTFLLNEAEILGPPPLPASKIRMLPVITISEEHVEKGMQCTVCMDDFAIREKAKNLPCDHIYHEKCITPWLERHATCPNCRKTVEVSETKSKDRRSRSCPRSYSSETINTGSRQLRFAETRPSLGTIFSATLNPFRLF